MSFTKMSAEYVFRTFPSEKNGEWVQIRSRNGLPEEKVVALPVKRIRFIL